jgi:hypothetical protein
MNFSESVIPEANNISVFTRYMEVSSPSQGVSVWSVVTARAQEV